LAPAPEPTESQLGLGEIEALSLAKGLHAELLITDDLAARREASRRGIPVIGTLGAEEPASAGSSPPIYRRSWSCAALAGE